jgi:hypothetical protein
MDHLGLHRPSILSTHALSQESPRLQEAEHPEISGRSRPPCTWLHDGGPDIRAFGMDGGWAALSRASRP